MSEPDPVAAPDGRPRRWRRRLLLTPLWGLGGLVLGLGLLTTKPGNDLLRRGVLRLADGQLQGGSLELGELRTRIVDGLTLRDVHLSTDDGTTLVQADVIAVTWRLGGVFGRRLQLPTVRLDTPVVDLSTGPDGRLRLVEVLGIPPAAEDAPSGPWAGVGGRLELPDVQIDDGRISWGEGHVEELDLRGGAVLDGADVELSGLAVTGVLRGPLDRRLSVDLDGGLRSGDLWIEGGDLALGASRLQLRGEVAAVQTAPRLQLDIGELFVAQAELGELSGGGSPAVDLAVHGSIRGPLEDLAAQLQLDGGQGGSLTADLRADLAAERPAWAAVISGADLDLGALYPEQAGLEVRAGRLGLEVAGSGFSWPAGMAVHARLDGRELTALGDDLPSVRAELSVGAGQIRVLGARVRHGAGTVSAKGTLSLDEQQGRLDADARLPRLSRLEDLAGIELTGGATWTPSLRLSWADDFTLDASGAVRLSGVGTSGVTLEEGGGRLDLAWRDGALQVDAPALEGRRVTLSGVVAEELRSSVDVDWSAERGATVVADVELASLHADGLAARVDGLGGVVEVAAPPEGDTRVGGTFDLTGLRATGPEAPASRGTLRLDMVGEQLHASVDVAPVDEGGATIRAVVDRAGEGWRISEVLFAPTPKLSVVSRSPIVITPGDGPLPAVEARLGGSAGQLSVDGAGGERLSVTGQDLVLDRWAEVGRLLPGPDGAPSAALPLAGTGALDLALVVDGEGTPRQLEGSVDLAALRWGEDLIDLNVQAGISGPLRRPALALDLSTATGRVLTARGSLPLDLDAGWTACGQESDLRVVLAPVRLTELRTHLPALPDLAARASADLRVTGDACDPRIVLVAAADAPVGLEGEVVRADLDLVRDGASVEVEGFVEEAFARRLELRGSAVTRMGQVLADLRTGAQTEPLSAPTTWLDTLALNVVPLGVPLASVRRFVELPPALEGRVAGGLLLTGRVDAPVVQGALQLSGGRVGRADVDSALLVLAPSEKGYTATVDARMRPDDAPDDADALPLHVQAEIPITLDPTVEDPLAAAGLFAELSGSVPLAALEGVIEGVRGTAGVLELDGALGGSVRQPTGELTVRTQGAALSYHPLGVSYSDIDLELVATHQRVVLQSLSLHSNLRKAMVRQERTATIRGSLELEDLSPTSARLQIDADRFWIIGKSDMEVAVSGSLEASGPWPGLSVTGDLALSEGDMSFDETFFIGDRSLAVDERLVIHRPSLQRELVVREVVEAPPLWRDFSIDVDLDLQRNLRLSARMPLQGDYGELGAALSRVGLDAELDGELTITQDKGAIAIRGEVEPVRGTVAVLGSTFTLQDSTITFPGDGFSDPLLDIDAVKTLPDTEVGVEVTGRVSAFDIALSSPEYPDQTDVVSLLLFGKPASEMGEEGQASNSLISSALGALARGGVERALGNDMVDQFELDSTGQIRVGKAITDKLFLRYELNPTRDEQENLNEVTLEYLISRRLYAEFTTGDRGASSIDIFWRWRF